MIPIAVLLAVGLAAPPAPAAAQASPAPEISEPRDWNQPPPGSPDDVALWTRLRDVQNASVVHMARVAQAAFRIRYGRYYESLDERAGSGSADGRDAARRMRARVEKAAADADAAIPKKGLRVRVCKYTLLDLDQRMAFPEDASFRAELPEVRREARGCVDELAAFSERLAPLADALESSLADADALLGRATPRPPAAAAPAAAPAAR